LLICGVFLISYYHERVNGLLFKLSVKSDKIKQ